MKLQEFVDTLKKFDILLEVKGDTSIEIKNISYNSREANRSTLFICKGFEFKEDYLFDAVVRGIPAFVAERDYKVPDSITRILVKNSRLALACLSSIFYNNPSEKLNMFGLTGTKGKTTTSYMLKAILESCGKRPGIIGTIETLIGNKSVKSTMTTPESLDLQRTLGEMVDSKLDSAILEVSSQGLKYHRVNFCNFDIGIFLNISEDHISPKEHPDFEDYIKSKAKIFDICRYGVVYGDDPKIDAVIKSPKCEKLIKFGFNDNNDVRAINPRVNGEKVSFELISPWYQGNVDVNMMGLFNINNALAAISAAGLMGIPFDAVKKGLLNFKVKGRMEVLKDKDITVIVDFAHNKLSLINLLSTVKESFKNRRIICLFGCPGEKAFNRRKEMGSVSGNYADLTIITTDNPGNENPDEIMDMIESGVSNAGGSYLRIPDRKSAIKKVILEAQSGDVIVLAGKGHEEYQYVKGIYMPFSDKKLSLKYLKQRAYNKDTTIPLDVAQRKVTGGF